MTGVARVGQDVAAGVQIGNGQNFVIVENTPWIILGDINAMHGFPPHVPGPDAMSGHSTFVHIDGIAVCRAGHAAGCGHPTTGSSTVYLEE